MRIVLFIFLLSSLLFAEILIVTNKNTKIDTLSKNVIRYLYLKKINSINDISLIPLTNKDKSRHEEFVNKILDKSISQYNSYWARLVFTGKKSIPKKLTDNEICEQLNKVNTIAYIYRSELTENMKIIYKEEQ